ncbi:MAG: methyltransferase [Candidatus Woesearchaeota archaeon]
MNNINLFSSFLNIRDSIYANDLIIYGLTKSGIIDLMKKDPPGITFQEIVRKLKLKPRPLKVLIDLLVAMKFFELKKDKYFLDEDFEKGVVNSGLIYYLTELNQREFVLGFEKVFKTDEPIPYPKRNQKWEKSLDNTKFVKEFNNTMKVRGALLAKELFKNINLNKNKTLLLLDIGGSSGIYSKEATLKFNKLNAIVLDKNTVLKKTIKGKRLRFECLDMFTEGYPNADLHLYSNVLHDWNEKENLFLLKKSYKSLPKKGKIIVHDAFYGAKAKEDISILSYSALLMLLTHGRCYSIGEMKELLEKAGFKGIIYKKTIAGRGVIIGEKH